MRIPKTEHSEFYRIASFCAIYVSPKNVLICIKYWLLFEDIYIYFRKILFIEIFGILLGKTRKKSFFKVGPLTNRPPNHYEKKFIEGKKDGKIYKNRNH